MPSPRADRTQVGTGSTHAATPAHRPYRRFEASPAPESLVSSAFRTGATTALREAADRNDAEHVEKISTLGYEYVRAWLQGMADQIESREYEKEADGNYVREDS